MAPDPKLNEQQAGPTLAPIVFAIGVAVILVGLVVNLEVIAPAGVAITVLAAVAWIRGSGRRSQAQTKTLEPAPDEGERFPRSRLPRACDPRPRRPGRRRRGAARDRRGGPAGVRPHQGAGDRPRADRRVPQGQFVIATFLSDPQAGEISRRAAFVRNNGFVGKSPSFTIMSSRCTHVGCPTQPNGPIFVQKEEFRRTNVGEIKVVPTLPAGGFGCPCHGSQFDTEGNRTAGPAPRALDRYQFSVRNGRLILGPIYSVSRVDGAGGPRGSTASNASATASLRRGPSPSSYPLDPIS